MQFHNLQPKTERIRSARVGRGGRRGKTSGRGGKGQTARSGHKLRPELRDIIKKLPKRRGHGVNALTTRIAPFAEVKLGALEVFENGAEVTPAILLTRGIIELKDGRIPKVKIIGGGTLSRKLNVADCLTTASVKTAIEAAGGSIK
jgi:large subunit ribosomal protein L15